MRFALVTVSILALAGCAGGAPDSACEVIDPPPASSPTVQDSQRLEMQSTGDPTAPIVDDAQDC